MRLLRKLTMYAVLAAGLTPSVRAAPAEHDRPTTIDPRDALLKIHVAQLIPSYSIPWRPGMQHTNVSSGFVVAGHRIITNAHVVSNATFVQVQRYGGSERVPARVLFVAHDADLALLTVDQPGFFDTIPTLDIGDLPELQQEVLVLGFSEGGDALSITRGIVSRVEHKKYVHTNVSLLAGQIDGAVNSGNSGGPVLSNSEVVGIAMQVNTSANNIAYMVPPPVIERFLADVSDGRFDGVPGATFRWQRLEAVGLRQKYGLSSLKTGILILDTLPGSAASRVLKVGDILLSVDGQPVGSDGTIKLRSRERTNFQLLFQNKQLGDHVELELFRKGVSVRANLLLDYSVSAGRLVPGPLYDRRPTYYVFGGFAFCPLTVNYLHAWGGGWRGNAPQHLINLLSRPLRFEDEEPVVVCAVLRDELTSGYEELQESLIALAADEPVRNLAHLIDTIESESIEPLVLETHDGKQIVFDRDRVRREGPGILAKYQIMRDRSDNLATTATVVVSEK